MLYLSTDMETCAPYPRFCAHEPGSHSSTAYVSEALSHSTWAISMSLNTRVTGPHANYLHEVGTCSAVEFGACSGNDPNHGDAYRCIQYGREVRDATMLPVSTY